MNDAHPMERVRQGYRILKHVPLSALPATLIGMELPTDHCSLDYILKAIGVMKEREAKYKAQIQ